MKLANRDTSHVLSKAVRAKGWDVWFVDANTTAWYLYKKNRDGTDETKKFNNRQEFNDYLGLI